MKKNKIYSLMVLAAFFWSGAFIAGKYSVAYIPVFTLTFLRFFPAAILMYIAMRVTNCPYRLNKTHVPIFLMTGMIGMFGYHILFFSCLKYTTAINSSIIGAMNPIVTVIIAFIALRQKLSRRQAAGICLSFAGVFLTITGADLHVIRMLNFNKGDILMMLAVICWAAYGVISSSAMSSDKPTAPILPMALTFYSFIVCLIALVPFVVMERPWTFLPKLPAASFVAALYMAVFPSFIGYLIQQFSIKEIGAGRTSVFINLVPVFSTLLAILLLDETLQPIKFFTAWAIIAGVIITQDEKHLFGNKSDDGEKA